MCGYRIWGIVAGLIGAFLTYFLIGFLGINISSDDARKLALCVGIGIYFFPNFLFWILKKINSATESYQQPTNIPLKKESWVIIMEILKSDCRSKNMEWIQWGEKINGFIKEKTDRATSPDENVTISFYGDNLRTLKKIIDRLGMKS
jgi:hypothetical protein